MLPLLLDPYDPPAFSEPKVRRDGHVHQNALYSVPEGNIGQTIKARALVALSTHDDDIPLAQRAYATRNVDVFRRQAAEVGPHAEAYVERLLQNAAYELVVEGESYRRRQRPSLANLTDGDAGDHQPAGDSGFRVDPCCWQPGGAMLVAGHSQKRPK